MNTKSILLVSSLFVLLCGCQPTKVIYVQQLAPEPAPVITPSSVDYPKVVDPEVERLSRQIAGYYEYQHSWDYKSPDGVGEMHCDEFGTLEFFPDGTYVDHAIQLHTHLIPNGVAQQYEMRYYCEGRWRVEGGKFLFCEHAENFVMDPTDPAMSPADRAFARRIAQQNTPVSSRWFTFDIDRLDSEWFVWSYTDRAGVKTTWDMQRSRR